jgi:acetaldehyde dehydrogenase (acetylating)
LGPGTFGKSIISENVSAKHLINIKRLAFETRPINKETGNGRREAELWGQKTESPAPARSWMEEIEERIRLKAGNQPVHPKPYVEEMAHKEENKEAKYGTGMTIDEVERVMKEFKK